jgi:hypothetical protein
VPSASRHTRTVRSELPLTTTGVGVGTGIGPRPETAFAVCAAMPAACATGPTGAAVVVEIVHKPEDQHGFAVPPRRWVVKRTLFWLMRCRRLVRDYERLPHQLRNHGQVGHDRPKIRKSDAWHLRTDAGSGPRVASQERCKRLGTQAPV